MVIVSHSAALASGVVELAGQMAPDIIIEAAGGDEDGGLGTSFEKVEKALSAADTGSGVVVLYDLGSALLTAETAVELVDPAAAERIRIVDAPLVEAAIEAAVAAQNGSDLAAVAAVAAGVGTHWRQEGQPSDGSASDQDAAGEPEQDTLAAVAVVLNPQGLHARPAGQLVRDLAAWPDTEVLIGKDPSDMVESDSVLMLVGLGLVKGDQVRVTAQGPHSREAVDHVVGAFADGFGELD